MGNNNDSSITHLVRNNFFTTRVFALKELIHIKTCLIDHCLMSLYMVSRLNEVTWVFWTDTGSLSLTCWRGMVSVPHSVRMAGCLACGWKTRRSSPRQTPGRRQVF